MYKYILNGNNVNLVLSLRRFRFYSFSVDWAIKIAFPSKTFDFDKLLLSNIYYDPHTPSPSSFAPGCGFKSFIKYYILTLTRLADDYVGAAETGVTETTRKATFYLHPTNDKIKLWDLPGTGAYLMLL